MFAGCRVPPEAASDSTASFPSCSLAWVRSGEKRYSQGWLHHLATEETTCAPLAWDVPDCGG